MYALMKKMVEEYCSREQEQNKTKHENPTTMNN